MELIKDIIGVNKQTFVKTLNSIKSHWEALLIVLVYLLISQIMLPLVSNIFSGALSIISGILMALIEAALISSFLFVLNNIVQYNRFRWKDVIEGLNYYLWKVYGILFIFFIVNFILSSTLNLIGNIGYLLSLIFQLFIIFALNPLPETIYLKNYDSRDSILYCIEFIKENFLNWFVPNIVFGACLFFIFNISNTNLLAISVSNFVPFILELLLISVILSFFMIYRGHLFKFLSTSTRRKRQFMNKF